MITLHGLAVLDKMKSIITFGIVLLLLINIVSSQLNTEKPSLTKDLETKEITKQNKTKLLDIYTKSFPEVNKINNYKQYGNITLIYVNIGDKEKARIITNTKKFEEVLK